MANGELLSTARSRAAEAYERLQTEASEEQQRSALRRTKKVSDLLDNAVRVPGTEYRIGADAIVGALPVAGDVVTGVASLYVVAEAARLGVPAPVLARMLLYVGADIAIGSVPILGDVADVAFKSSQWNVNLLEKHLDVEIDDAVDAY